MKGGGDRRLAFKERNKAKGAVKEEKSGADGDAFRLQLGIVYSLFD